MTMSEDHRKKSRLGSILMWLLIAAGLFIMLFAVLQLAGWVVRTTFPEDELSSGIQARTVAVISLQPGYQSVAAAPAVPARR